jgi:hypothetical protein
LRDLSKKRFFTEERLANIFRWWSASAVYYFVGWGTGLGGQDTVIDMVFFLGLAIGITEMLIVNPVIRHMFRTSEFLNFRDKSLKQRVLYRLGTILRSMFLVILIVITYDVINVMAIALFSLHPDQVFLPGEPILFGIFYVVFYGLLRQILVRFKEKVGQV